MTQSKKHILRGVALAGSVFAGMMMSGAAQAQVACPVTYAQLKAAVTNAAASDSTGLNNDFWSVAVNRSGTVCAVAYSGGTVYSQWLLSRQIAAAKAFTANGLSLDAPKGPISTAQLYGFVQTSPSGGNPLFGLEGGNVLDSTAAFTGDVAAFGTASDPMVGKRVGGTITFGGGLAIYSGNAAVGAIGVSGDTACADHSVAWRMRYILGVNPPFGSGGAPPDTITLTNNATPTTGGHPRCPNDQFTQGQSAASAAMASAR